MIFITGDTHGGHDFMKLKTLAQKVKGLTKNDYVIIAGDFGGVWSKGELQNDLQKYIRLPYTVLFVDGNHENFDLLDAMPVFVWKGGKSHRVAPNVIHLMRGQVFTLGGKTFFTFGGAESVDKMYRKEGTSWWPQEVPSAADYEEAYRNLAAVGNRVDYIVTHTVDEKTLLTPPLITHTYKPAYYTNAMLTQFEKKVKYGHWYFGHYHLDAQMGKNKTALYNNVINLDTQEIVVG